MPKPVSHPRSSALPDAAERQLAMDAASKVGVDLLELADLFLLESVRGFGPQKFKDLLHAGLRPGDALRDPRRLPMKGKNADKFRAAIDALDEGAPEVAEQRAVRQIVRAHENHSQIVTLWSKDYPANVFDSNNAVPALYVRGPLKLLKARRNVACVGSREIGVPYADRQSAFAAEATRAGYAVVSGFATGADRLAHEGAWKAGGHTILVMPCGLDRPFPPENRELWQDLLAYPGAVMVSEFPFGTSAAALTLRKRNKLIVAFALAVLIGQSSSTGGAMNAYRFAIEQRKHVATFAAGEGKDTSGNAEIAAGPAPKKRRKTDAQSSLDGSRSDRAPLLPTVFPHDRDDPAAWRKWLDRLASST